MQMSEITGHYGGENLGGRRFELIEQLGRLVLDSTYVSRITTEAEYRRRSFDKRMSKRTIANTRARGRGGISTQNRGFPGSSPCPPFHTSMEERANANAPLSLPRREKPTGANNWGDTSMDSGETWS